MRRPNLRLLACQVGPPAHGPPPATTSTSCAQRQHSQLAGWVGHAWCANEQLASELMQLLVRVLFVIFPITSLCIAPDISLHGPSYTTVHGDDVTWDDIHAAGLEAGARIGAGACSSVTVAGDSTTALLIRTQACPVDVDSTCAHARTQAGFQAMAASGTRAPGWPWATFVPRSERQPWHAHWPVYSPAQWHAAEVRAKLGVGYTLPMAGIAHADSGPDTLPSCACILPQASTTWPVLGDRAWQQALPRGELLPGAPLVVELKPKMGGMPAIASNMDFPVAAVVPRFTAQQASKRALGRAGELSRYNPCDLFSGTRKRVQLALRQLCRCPQNNLLISTSQAGSWGKRSSALLDEWLQQHTGEWNRDALLAALADILSTEELLPRLLRLQDANCIEEDVRTAWQGVAAARDASASSVSTACPRQVAQATTSAHNQSTAAATLLRYIRARAWRDCSIILTLRLARVPPGAQGYSRRIQADSPRVRHHIGVLAYPSALLEPGRAVLYQARVIDVDPRDVAAIPYYLQQFDYIWRSYMQSNMPSPAT